MEYVTESLTVSGKWCTIFADKMKVKRGVGKTKNTPCQRFACRPDKAPAPHPAKTSEFPGHTADNAALGTEVAV